MKDINIEGVNFKKLAAAAAAATDETEVGKARDALEAYRRYNEGTYTVEEAQRRIVDNGVDGFANWKGAD